MRSKHTIRNLPHWWFHKQLHYYRPHMEVCMEHFNIIVLQNIFLYGGYQHFGGIFTVQDPLGKPTAIKRLLPTHVLLMERNQA